MAQGVDICKPKEVMAQVGVDICNLPKEVMAQVGVDICNLPKEYGTGRR